MSAAPAPVTAPVTAPVSTSGPAPASTPARAPTSPELARACAVGAALKQALSARIVGQESTINAVLAAVLANGHTLLIGPPGVAKTLLVRTLSEALDWSFKRIQFTPDLLPADITGTEVLREDRATGTRDLAFVAGPVFAHVLLADEINRATPKTQSALLEAMQERSVTAGGKTHLLPQPFLVLATENPVEQEGTYRLPEAQLDRFLLAIDVGYPDLAQEKAIALLPPTAAAPAVPRVAVTPAEMLALQAAVASLPVAAVAVDYAVALTRATRPQGAGASTWARENLRWGCGPRATQHLIAAARAHAVLNGATAVDPSHIRAMAPLVLAHRLVPTFSAAGKGLSGAHLIAQLLGTIKV